MKTNPLVWMVFAVGWLACSPRLHAATLTCASLSHADVQRAVEAAADGDVVQLPPGTATWTNSVAVAGKFITVQGAGIDRTTIRAGDYAPSSSHPTHRMFDITTKPGGLTRLTALTLDGGAGARDAYNKGMVALGGTSMTWRIDHLRIRATRTCAMHIYASGGVVDHNRIELVGWTFGIYGFNGGGGYGDAAWAEGTSLGAAGKAFFIEDNLFAADALSFALDGWAGQRVVIRHNTFKNALIGNHGTETSGRLRGARSFEIYGNTLSLAGRSFPDAISFRSGTGVIFSNTITGDFREALRVDNYRDWQAFGPWGAACGESPFDKNDTGPDGKPIVYNTGAHAGATNGSILASPGKSWKPHQWVGYSVFNDATGKSSIIISNSSDTITARLDGSHGGPNLVWNPGDGFRIERCLVALDQMGRGKGKLLSGDQPGPAIWPEQQPDPAFVWSNTLNGRVSGLVSGSPHVRENVDFFNGRPKPGYSPYSYPHPLVAR